MLSGSLEVLESGRRNATLLSSTAKDINMHEGAVPPIGNVVSDPAIPTHRRCHSIECGWPAVRRGETRQPVHLI